MILIKKIHKLWINHHWRFLSQNKVEYDLFWRYYFSFFILFVWFFIHFRNVRSLSFVLDHWKMDEKRSEMCSHSLTRFMSSFRTTNPVFFFSISLFLCSLFHGSKQKRTKKKKKNELSSVWKWIFINDINQSWNVKRRKICINYKSGMPWINTL